MERIICTLCLFLLISIFQICEAKKRGVPVGQVYNVNTGNLQENSNNELYFVIPKQGAVGVLRNFGSQTKRFSSSFPSFNCNCYFYLTGGTSIISQDYPFYQINYPNSTNDLEVFSLESGEFLTGTWSNMIITRTYHVAVEYDGGIWVWGGGSSLMERYDFVGGFWEIVPASNSAPEDVFGCSFTKVDCMIYIFGGLKKSGNVTNELWSFDFVKLTWTLIANNGPSPRVGSALHYYINDSSLILFGGTNNINQAFNDLWKFDLNTSTWSQIIYSPSNKVPSGRWGMASFLNNNELFITLGEIKQNGDIWIWNFNSSSWKQLEKQINEVTPTPTSGFASLYLANNLLLFSGVSLQAPFSLNILGDIWYFTELGLTWWRYECYPGFVFDFPICKLTNYESLDTECSFCNCREISTIRTYYVGSALNRLQMGDNSGELPQC